MKKLKFNDNKLKMFSPTVKISFNLQNHPTFYSEERLVNYVRRRECFDGLSILLVYY